MTALPTIATDGRGEPRPARGRDHEPLRRPGAGRRRRARAARARSSSGRSRCSRPTSSRHRLGGAERDRDAPGAPSSRSLARARARARPRPVRLEAASRAAAARRARSAALRTYEQAVAYAPNQVFIGNARPEELWDASARPGGRTRSRAPRPSGRFGDVMSQAAFYELLAELDQFDLVKPRPSRKPGRAPAVTTATRSSARSRGDHESDESLTPHVLLENLACKASGVHALRHLLARTGVDPSLDRRTRSGAARRPWATATSAAVARSPRRSPRTAGSTRASGST